VGGVVFLILVAVACYFFRRQSEHPADNVEHSSVTTGQGEPNLCTDGNPHNFESGGTAENVKRRIGGGLNAEGFGFGGGLNAENEQDNGQSVVIYCSKCGAAKRV
jgi:hypothetical protein